MALKMEKQKFVTNGNLGRKTMPKHRVVKYLCGDALYELLITSDELQCGNQWLHLFQMGRQQVDWEL